MMHLKIVIYDDNNNKMKIINKLINVQELYKFS